MVSPTSTECGTRLREVADVASAELRLALMTERYGPESKEVADARRDLEAQYQFAGVIEPL